MNIAHDLDAIVAKIEKNLTSLEAKEKRERERKTKAEQALSDLGKIKKELLYRKSHISSVLSGSLTTLDWGKILSHSTLNKGGIPRFVAEAIRDRKLVPVLGCLSWGQISDFLLVHYPYGFFSSSVVYAMKRLSKVTDLKLEYGDDGLELQGF